MLTRIDYTLFKKSIDSERTLLSEYVFLNEVDFN